MTTEEFFKQIVIPYWPQITLFTGITIGGIGYILQAIFSYNLKKRELSFSFDLKKNEIQFNKKLEHQIENIIQYHKKYIDVQRILIKIHTKHERGNLDAETIQELSLHHKELWDSYYLLELLLSKDLHQHYELANNMFNMLIQSMTDEIKGKKQKNVLIDFANKFSAIDDKCKTEFRNASKKFRKIYFNEMS